MKVYYLGHYWSLTVEEHFYFILPLLLILFARRGNRLLVVLGGVLLVAFGLRYIPAPMRFDEVAWLTQASHRRFDQLLMGGALALILGRKGREKMIEHNVYSLNISERFFISWILPGVFLFLLWVMPTIFPYPFNNFMGQTIYGLFALGLVFLATYEKGFIGNAPVLGKMLEYIGSRSYSIYLAHVAFISLNIQWGNDLIPWFGEATLNLPSILWLRFLLILIVSILAAEITYRLIERPFIRYGSKFYS
jgi:peptidoglycan/LPS O-acetylase OafA/YrhL